VRSVHFVMPDGIDDSGRPSGGNTYDRYLCGGLSSIGWSVHEHPLAGFWSSPDAAAFSTLEDALRRIPDGAVVLLDGLVASTAPEVLVAHEHRLRLIALVHMPLGHRPPDVGSGEVRAREREALSATAAVITTSDWSAHRLMELYELSADRVHVAEPGAASAELAAGTTTGEALLCVAAVTADKGHDVLLESLASLGDLPWHCVCVGSLDRDPACAQAVRRRVARGLAGRVTLAGTATGAELDRAYAGADVMVLASRAETYGMVVTEALARGLPVIATNVGGISEALGHAIDGSRPGMLVAPDDPSALAGALRSWLGQPGLRAHLRQAARERRQALSGWANTASRIADVLTQASR
jgi:glycosyltransferase involved in cell wall biosynthesis